MLRKALAFVLPIALAACASAPLPSGEPVRMATAYPAALVNIPVDDAKTKSVAAALFEPRGAGPFPAVVILSGCAGVNADVSVVSRVNSDYLSKGIATLVVDSFTPRGLAEVCSDSNLLAESIAFRVKDVYAAIAWLSTRSKIDARRIFLQGYSHGAITAIAAIDGQWPQTRSDKVAGVIAYYPYCSTNSKFSVPTIILVGEKDDWTPSKLCEGIVDRANVEITVYPNVAHAFAAPGLDIVYLGHRLLYDAAATNDGQRRALALIQSRGK
jgi:dienelactone hydrolase